MNDILTNYSNNFVMIYLNNILIYNQFKKKHIQHVQNYFQQLRKTEIQEKIDKCEFHITETKYLKMRIKKNEIRINLEKISTIID